MGSTRLLVWPNFHLKTLPWYIAFGRTFIWRHNRWSLRPPQRAARYSISKFNTAPWNADVEASFSGFLMRKRDRMWCANWRGILEGTLHFILKLFSKKLLASGVDVGTSMLFASLIGFSGTQSHSVMHQPYSFWSEDQIPFTANKTKKPQAPKVGGLCPPDLPVNKFYAHYVHGSPRPLPVRNKIRLYYYQ
jgi:hypothetical protein